MIKEQLLAEAALILEQEGWLVTRIARESGGHRIRAFSARYEAWQAKVAALRLCSPDDHWPAPCDNSSDPMNTVKQSREKKLRWVKARLTSGEFKGPFWGAEVGGAFLMIVPEKCAAGVQYAVWCADTVFGEKPTLAEAQAFAETMLRGHADRIGVALCRLRLLDRRKVAA